MEKETKIWLCGAQGTGKTTVLNLFKEAGFPVITEVVRKLVREKGITINQDGTDDTQRMVFQVYKDTFEQGGKYLSDRGLIDVLAYSCEGFNDKKVSMDVLNEQYAALAKYIRNNPDLHIVYFPIEFAVVPDGVRSVDESYRYRIDEHVKSILDKLSCEIGIEYLTITGSPEERARQICEYIDLDLF